MKLLPLLQKTLGDRYSIEREIGHGGTALVYLAHDRKHQRRVAIKVLRPELAVAIGPERFLREIDIAARLSHPHILPLYDSGATERLSFYVMPVVEGKSLRDRITQERQLPLEESVRLTGQVADALAYAHAQGVVHRDIKPENILLVGDDALVADFGIAKAADGAGERLTETGIAVGTPAYMSPEQAAGARTIDGRADVYALGCVLYEMLAGQPPFTGATAQAVLARHALDPVPPLLTVRPDLPEAVDRATRRALAKAPADRFATPAAFKAALLAAATERPRRRPISKPALAAALMVLGIAVTGVAVLARGNASQAIAVLPFANVGGDSSDEYFGDGMSEELITALSRIPTLRVAARTSAFSFKHKGLTAPAIGRALQVSALLEGSVRRSGNRVRVHAQLVNAADGYELWSDVYERDARDVFAVQDEIARAIVGALQVKLGGGASTSLVKRSTESSEAHDLYLQGRYFFAKRDSASLRKARAYFAQAIAKDSGYALAYAGLSDAYSHSSVFGYVPPLDVYAKAKGAAQRALALDSSLAEVHTSLGFLALFFEWDWPTAARELDQALALNPGRTEPHLFKGWYYVATGRPSEAINEVREAVRLDPFWPVVNIRLADMLYFARRYDQALAQTQRVLELDSTFFQIRVSLARVYRRLGRCDEALAVLEGLPRQTPAQYAGVPGLVKAECGQGAGAEVDLARLRAEARAGGYVSHYSLAMIHAGLGDKERAFAQLDSAYAERAWALFLLNLDPEFDRLRGDPRFARIVDRVANAHQNRVE